MEFFLPQLADLHILEEILVVAGVQPLAEVLGEQGELHQRGPFAVLAEVFDLKAVGGHAVVGREIAELVGILRLTAQGRIRLPQIVHQGTRAEYLDNVRTVLLLRAAHVVLNGIARRIAEVIDRIDVVIDLLRVIGQGRFGLAVKGIGVDGTRAVLFHPEVGLDHQRTDGCLLDVIVVAVANILDQLRKTARPRTAKNGADDENPVLLGKDIFEVAEFGRIDQIVENDAADVRISLETVVEFQIQFRTGLIARRIVEQRT